MAEIVITSQMMKIKILRVMAWTLVWIIFSIGFSEYLPQHAHMPFSVWVYPVMLPIVWFVAVFNPSELAVDPTSSDIVVGAVFWIVMCFLFFFLGKKQHSAIE